MAERRQRFENEKHEYHDPSLLLGCWFDERARREADFREHVDRFSREELPIQKCKEFTEALNKQARWSESLDGFLRNGSTVALAWSCSPRLLGALPRAVRAEGYYEQPCLATGALPPGPDILPTRAAIKIFRSDTRIPDNVALMNGECLLLNLAEPSRRLFLCRESPDPMPLPNPKWMVNSGSHALWKTNGESTYITANTSVVIYHVASGHTLTMEEQKPIKTLLGIEWEISCRYERYGSGTWRFLTPYQQPVRTRKVPVIHSNVWKIWK